MLGESLHALKGWKTLLLSLAIAVAGVLQATDWATVVPERFVGPALLAIGVLMAVLRAFTDTPVGRK